MNCEKTIFKLDFEKLYEDFLFFLYSTLYQLARLAAVAVAVVAISKASYYSISVQYTERLTSD